MKLSSPAALIATISVLVLSGLLGFATRTAPTQATAEATIDVGVVVDDLDESLQFYTEVLGMEQRRTIDINDDFGQRSGLTGGTPTTIQVLTLGEGDAATEWKLMTFPDLPDAVSESNITHQQGMQYMTIHVDHLGPYVDRARSHGLELMGETPIPLGEENHFLLLQAPEGTFVEVIGPLAQ